MAKKHEKDTRTVWLRAKEALKDANLPATQVEAAKICGVEQPSVSDWNKPGKYPDMRHAVALATKTNVCVQWLYNGDGPKHPGPPEDPTAEALWSLWDRLSDLTKGEILGIAKHATKILPQPAPGIVESESSDLYRRGGR